MKTLETARLILRDWRTQDCDDLFAYAQLPAVAYGAGWPPHKTVEDSLAVIVGLYMNRCYAITLRESGRVVGNIGLHETAVCGAFRCLRGRELGFHLTPAYWGQGLMTEAATAVLADCFAMDSDAPLDYLLLAHFPENERSRAVAQRLGFRYLFDREQLVAQLGVCKTEQFYLKPNPNIFG